MGRKKDGYVNAKKKVSGKGKGRATAAKRGTGVASLTPLAPSTYLCGTCDRKLLPGAPYEIHGKKCRLKAANAADHAARVLDTAGATARLAGMKAAEIAARLAPVEGSDDEEHWSDYEFGGGGEDELGGHDKFDWGSAPEGTGSPRSRATTPSEGTPEFDEVDAVLGQKPGQVEFRTINGVTLECHLPASVLKDPAWKNTRPPPTQVPYRSPSPKKKKTTTRKGAREDRPRPSPTPAPGDSGIPGDGTNPWHPFQTWTDFKVAQTLKDLGASGAKIDKFLGVLNDRRFKVSEMRIATAKKLEECLAYGRSLARAPWKSEDIVIGKEDGMDTTLTVWYRSIKEIVQELLGRPEVARHMDWVPQRYYKKDAQGKNQRVYHDFDSGDYWWLLHENLRDGDYVAFLHLYADASKITTFGNNKVWPVRLWLGNLPYKYRTDASLVGSSLVGYVPIIEPIAGQKARKQPWFRRARHEVYQSALSIILRDLIDEPKHGYCMAAGDGEPSRFCHFCIGCISMDLEELYKAFLGRGTMANSPCVCCKVPRNRQKDLTTIFEARSMEEARAVQAEYTRLAAARRKGEAEALLKQHSTYRHTSALSLLKQPDIHKAIGNDELHRDASGNWGKHVVPVIVDQAGDDGGRLLDARIQVYPTFPGLRAFSDFTGKPWVDASYYRALHAVVLFIAPGTLGTHEHHLLKLIRYWAIMHQYDGLHIQTDDTLAKLQVVISRIELIMKRIAQLCRKSIDYPKFHNLGKVVARMKLVAVGKFTSTRVGEELHRDDHAFYKTSNKRDVTEQLVRQHEGKEIMDLIEGQAQRLALASNPPPPVKPKPRILPGSDDKVERRWPFGHFEELKRDVDVYNNFALKIRTLLYDPAGAKPKERPRMSAMPVISDCSISNYHLLHIRFTRIDNWEEGHDIARCHEIFGEKKRPRYDSVIYNPHHISLAEHDPAETDLYFGRLISVFRLTGPGGVSYRPMALVQNFVVEGRDESTWCLLGDEVDELNCSVIWCDSIVRACHTPPKPHDEMAPTTKKNAHDLQHDKGAFFINEFIDRDAYFRLKYALGVDLGTLESDYFDQVARENEEFVPPAAGPEGEDEEESYLGLDGPEDEELNEGDF